jgi:ubiquinol-cytochrome c reductase cytochrome c subunit
VRGLARSTLLLLMGFTVVGALVLGRSAPSAAQSATPDASTTPLQPPLATPAGGGRLIYLGDCAFCHGTDAMGSNRGPSLQGVGEADVDFYLSTGRMPIAEVVQAPQRQTPAYNPHEIGAIVAYVGSLGAATGPPIPQLNLGAASLSDGENLYTENCASCHSSVAAGGALTNGMYAPTLRPSTPTQIAEAIRVGPGTMPVFGSDTLSDDQVNSIVRYVVYLQHPEDRGGLDLSHLGPITEGMIAFVVGLGALLLFVRKIGTVVGE